MYPRTLLQLKLRVEYVPSLPPRHLNLIPGCVWSLAAGCNAGCMGEQSLFTHASPPSLSKRESTATTASCHIRRGHEKGGIGSRSVETLRLRGFAVFFFFFWKFVDAQITILLHFFFFVVRMSGFFLFLFRDEEKRIC